MNLLPRLFPPAFFAALTCIVTPAASGQIAPAAGTPPPLWLGDPGVDQAKARAQRQERAASRLRWEQDTTVGDYQRAGVKDRRWDADALACLEQYAHALAQEPDAPARIATAKAACERALAAGCNDPLLSYSALRLGIVPAGATPPELARLYAQAEANLEKSGYSPVRKLYASYRAAQEAARAVYVKPGAGTPPPPPPGTDAAASLGRAEAHLVELLRDPATNRDGMFGVTNEFFQFAEHNAAGRARVFAPLETVFTTGQLKDAGDTATGKLAEGLFWTSSAWNARGSGWAKEVTDEGWKRFAERLPKARAALEKAYALDPADPHVCRAMLTVEVGQDEERASMETWFRRAMDANPDYYDACDEKLYYLEPKWHGSAEDMLEFGHQCQATANWSARLPFILLLAHTHLATYESEPLAYWKKPEVWADVQQLYQAALAVNPGSAYDRTGYALYAYRAEQWKLADELFKALGDKADLSLLQCTPDQYEQMKHRAAVQAER